MYKDYNKYFTCLLGEGGSSSMFFAPFVVIHEPIRQLVAFILEKEKFNLQTLLRPRNLT